MMSWELVWLLVLIGIVFLVVAARRGRQERLKQMHKQQTEGSSSLPSLAINPPPQNLFTGPLWKLLLVVLAFAVGASLISGIVGAVVRDVMRINSW